ncbi:MAG: hypothetical protein LBB76_11785 [Azoarcus sp.]|jgi:predicted lactoylglutathione lyase|nr:hypothetical protein [Azoarcus sp.]
MAWIVVSSIPFRQQQTKIRAIRKDGLENGLEIRGSGWIPVVFKRRQEVENMYFQQFVDIDGNYWNTSALAFRPSQ